MVATNLDVALINGISWLTGGYYYYVALYSYGTVRMRIVSFWWVLAACWLV